MSGGFERNTRQKIVRLPQLVKPAGGGITSIELPKTGFLARLWLTIRVTTAGVVTTQNAVGISSAIRRVRVTTNSGIDLFNMSGPGYAWIFNTLQELEVTGLQTQNQGRSVFVTATTYNLDMVIPIMLNMHDPVGLIMLQNEQLQVSLTVEWEADANVILTGGGTLTGTCDVALEFFTVPVDKADYPPLNLVHQVIEDQIAIGAAGDYIYTIPRGNTYLQLGLGYTLVAATPADNWSRAIMRVNQSDILYDYVPNLSTQISIYKQSLVGRNLGTLYFDLLGSDGMGAYGGARDFINSAMLTDFQVVLTASAAGTLYVVRRMLMPLAA